MSTSSERQRVLEQLRDEIRRIERRPARREGYLSSGRPEIDRLLPGQGFPLGALSELTGGRASGKTAVALALLAGLGATELAAWLDGRADLYPPAAAVHGVDLTRLLLVRPDAPEPGARLQEALWAAEALLGSGAFAAVVIELPPGRLVRGGDAAGRRLQSAAEKGGAVGLWLSEPGAGVHLPATVRLELASDAGRALAARRVGRAIATVAHRRSGHAA